ncbi:Uncharacterised protein [Vibrio cholerae]|nr:Uncharacterised protein [Vibrio cholerae]
MALAGKLSCCLTKRAMLPPTPTLVPSSTQTIPNNASGLALSIWW